jgi:hypothetical protein
VLPSDLDPLLDIVMADEDPEEPEEEPESCANKVGLCTKCVPMPTRFGA